MRTGKWRIRQTVINSPLDEDEQSAVQTLLLYSQRKECLYFILGRLGGAENLCGAVEEKYVSSFCMQLNLDPWVIQPAVCSIFWGRSDSEL
jgi:hypothetical protein